MERPEAEIKTPTDQYDYEVEPVSADMIALTDALLEHKDTTSSLTFVDIVVSASREEALARLTSSRAGELIAHEDEQLAIESAGDYYPQLDIRKKKGAFTGVSVRAWGWNDPKYRYTDLNKEEVTYPREFKEYEGEVDKTRQLDISLHYAIGGTTVVETITMYGSSIGHDMPLIGREVWVSAYAETGYEGHKAKRLENVTKKDVYELLDIVAEIVGDTPESYRELQVKQLNVLRSALEVHGEGWIIDTLLKNSYPAQVLYDLKLARDNLQGSSLEEAISNPDMFSKGKAELRQMIGEYEARALRAAQLIQGNASGNTDVE